MLLRHFSKWTLHYASKDICLTIAASLAHSLCTCVFDKFYFFVLTNGLSPHDSSVEYPSAIAPPEGWKYK